MSFYVPARWPPGDEEEAPLVHGQTVIHKARVRLEVKEDWQDRRLGSGDQPCTGKRLDSGCSVRTWLNSPITLTPDLPMSTVFYWAMSQVMARLSSVKATPFLESRLSLAGGQADPPPLHLDLNSPLTAPTVQEWGKIVEWAFDGELGSNSWDIWVIWFRISGSWAIREKSWRGWRIRPTWLVGSWFSLLIGCTDVPHRSSSLRVTVFLKRIHLIVHPRPLGHDEKHWQESNYICKLTCKRKLRTVELLLCPDEE